MGARKSIRAEKLKAEKKQKAIAVLRDCPTSPLKMRIVADLIRGMEINKALGVLRYSKKAASIKLEKPIENVKDKEYLSFAQAGKLLGLSRQAVYNMVKAGNLKASKISSRLSFIRRVDIDAMLENRPYKTLHPKDTVPITDFYTTAEIKEKFGVKESWIYEIAKEHNIPRTFNRGRTYWSKKHIDSYFAKKAPDASITEWYSVAELQEKFGMTLSAIYTFVYKNVIPKRKEGKMVYYSKKHFDIAKGIATPEEPQYYTIPEAMEKYNLTRDQLYHYVKYHNITRIKVGKYTKILRSELDKFFEPPKIE